MCVCVCKDMEVDAFFFQAYLWQCTKNDISEIGGIYRDQGPLENILQRCVRQGFKTGISLNDK